MTRNLLGRESQVRTLLSCYWTKVEHVMPKLLKRLHDEMDKLDRLIWWQEEVAPRWPIQCREVFRVCSLQAAVPMSELFLRKKEKRTLLTARLSSAQLLFAQRLICQLAI